MEEVLRFEEELLHRGRGDAEKRHEEESLRIGEAFGKKQGYALGAELGFYEGIVNVLLCLPLEERKRNKLEKIKELLNSESEDHYDSLIDKVQAVRSKLSSVVTSFGIRLQTLSPEAGDLSF